MPNGGPTREGARATYEAKRWNTSCTDDGWSGKLVSLAWNESDGHVEEKWKWTPQPAKAKAEAKAKAKANGNGNGLPNRQAVKQSQRKNKGKAKAKGRGGN